MKPTTHYPTTHSVLVAAKRSLPSGGRRTRGKLWKSLVASPSVWTRLDRVAVLGGDDSIEGHSGCVNALHWSVDGSVLVTAGDDTRIHLWRLDPANASSDYPLRCTAKIHTGHTNNIFNAQILGGSSRIATCAADRQVRVFDVNRGGLAHHSGELTEYEEQQACLRILKCHRGRVKRIVTENSPDYFLTVAEDGAVRQHDLRTPHKCAKRNEPCPPPLLNLPLELSTIALSPLTPYNFVVAGVSPYAYLFDRRQTGRRLKEEWGVQCIADDLTSCVRRFGRKTKGQIELSGQEHITGSRMSLENGHELLLTYSADAVYLYSTRDAPEEQSTSQSSILMSNRRHKSDNDSTSFSRSVSPRSPILEESSVSVDTSRDPSPEATAEEEDTELQIPESLRLPIVLPRQKYNGASNVETVKDVNFVGPRDEYVVSGSDDGNFFIWDKTTGQLLDIHEGDESVVNVIEQHPSLPILSVSGIDNTVKIFAPNSGSRPFSRMRNHEDIVKNNTTYSAGPRLSRQRIQLSNLLLHYRRAWATGEDPPEELECVQQ